MVTLQQDGRFQAFVAELEKFRDAANQILLSSHPNTTPAELHRQIGVVAGLDTALSLPRIINDRVRYERDQEALDHPRESV